MLRFAGTRAPRRHPRINAEDRDEGREPEASEDQPDGTAQEADGKAHHRFGGDSLQGRYHLLRLHPFSAKELGIWTPKALRDLLKLGGFPEPF